jgi:hypothetical protein
MIFGRKRKQQRPVTPTSLGRAGQGNTDGAGKGRAEVIERQGKGKGRIR